MANEKKNPFAAFDDESLVACLKAVKAAKALLVDDAGDIRVLGPAEVATAKQIRTLAVDEAQIKAVQRDRKKATTAAADKDKELRKLRRKVTSLESQLEKLREENEMLKGQLFAAPQGGRAIG